MGASLNMFRKDEIHRLRELQYVVNQFALTAVIDTSGLLIDANSFLLRISGYDEKDIFKKPFQSLLSAESSLFFMNSVLPKIVRGLTWKGELSHVARNGYTYWTEATIVPILDSKREVTHFHFMACEISERKSVERALANNSYFFTHLMDRAPIGFFLANTAGECTYINRAWIETTGCRLRGALASGWLLAIHPDDRNRVKEAWLKLVDEGHAFKLEYRYLRPDGKIVWVLASAERVDFPSDLKTRFIRVEKDLTERQSSEALINEQRAQMVAASKMSSLGEMAGGIAHEINNPLAILQLRARQIVHLMKGGDASKEDQLLVAAENIRSTTERIASIIRSLKAFAREGHSDPFLPTSVKSLFENTLELCAARFKSHGIDLTIGSFADDLEIYCRSVEMFQVLMSLLNNAFGAVDNLDDKWVHLSVWDLGEFVEIWITDSGPKIPLELHEKLFQPFFTTKPVGSGTGLGLSIAKAVALDHGGDLYLDTVSENTRFVCRIPKKPMDSADTL